MDPEGWAFFDPGSAGAATAFTSTAVKLLDNRSAGSGGPYVDKTLFFQPVLPAQGTGPFGRKFYHLIGNVAEIVVGPDQKSYVIGGSAFSPPALSPLLPAPIKDNDVFSDVGFRVALTPPITPLRERMAQALANPVFLPD
jgi:hypothetical protein